jgi:hypothetical protein
MRCVSACAGAVFQRMFFVYVLDAPPDPLDLSRNTMYTDTETEKHGWKGHVSGVIPCRSLLSKRTGTIPVHCFLVGAFSFLLRMCCKSYLRSTRYRFRPIPLRYSSTLTRLRARTEYCAHPQDEAEDMLTCNPLTSSSDKPHPSTPRT